MRFLSHLGFTIALIAALVSMAFLGSGAIRYIKMIDKIPFVSGKGC